MQEFKGPTTVDGRGDSYVFVGTHGAFLMVYGTSTADSAVFRLLRIAIQNRNASFIFLEEGRCARGF